jgi:hypothetical protein
MSEELRIADSKRNRVDDQNHQNLLNGFKYNRLLNELSNNKVVFIHGLKSSDGGDGGDCNNESNKDAVIILEKPHFTENEIKAIIEKNFSTDLTLSNDIYKKFKIYPSEPYNSK